MVSNNARKLHWNALAGTAVAAASFYLVTAEVVVASLVVGVLAGCLIGAVAEREWGTGRS